MKRLLFCAFLFFSHLNAQQIPPAQQDSVELQNGKRLRLLMKEHAYKQCTFLVHYQNDAIKSASARIKDSQSVLYVQYKARERAIEELSNSILSELQELFPLSPMINDSQQRKVFVAPVFDEAHAAYSHAQDVKAQQLAEAKKKEEERLKRLKITQQIQALRMYPMLHKSANGKRASLLCCI